MLFRNVIKQNIINLGKNVAEDKLYAFIRGKKKTTSIVIATIYIILALSLPTILYHSHPIEEYQVSSETKLIYDTDMSLKSKDRNELTDATTKTHGNYFFLYYIEINCHEDEIMNKCTKLIDSCFTNYLYPNGAMSMALIHNAQNNKYYLYASKSMSEKTNTIDWFSLQSKHSEELLINTSSFGKELFDGSPAEVYNNVYQFIINNSYDDTTGELFALQQQKSYQESNLFLIYLADIVISIFVVLVYLIGASEFISNSNHDDRKKARRIIEKLDNEIIKENDLLNKKQECEETIVQDNISELNKSLSHPTKIIIDKLETIKYHDTESANISKQLIQKLLIVDNICESAILQDNIMFYLESFDEGLNDIIDYAKTHNTDFDTELELEIIKKALIIYLKITIAYISKYEAKKANGIDVTLNVLQQKAVLDGLIDT